MGVCVCVWVAKISVMDKHFLKTTAVSKFCFISPFGTTKLSLFTIVDKKKDISFVDDVSCTISVKSIENCLTHKNLF